MQQESDGSLCCRRPSPHLASFLYGKHMTPRKSPNAGPSVGTCAQIAPTGARGQGAESKMTVLLGVWMRGHLCCLFVVVAELVVPSSSAGCDLRWLVAPGMSLTDIRAQPSDVYLYRNAHRHAFGFLRQCVCY